MKQKQTKQPHALADHYCSDSPFGYLIDRRREKLLPLSHLMRTFVLIAAMVMSVGNVWGIGTKKNILTFDAVADDYNGQYSGTTLSWTLGYSNLLTFTGINGDLSEYDKLVLITDGYSSGNEYRVVVTAGENDYTWTLYSSGTKTLDLFGDNTNFKNGDNKLTKELLKSVSSIRIGGASSSGSITLSEAFLHKPLNWSKGMITFKPSNFYVDSYDASLTLSDNTVSKSNSSSYASLKLTNDIYCDASEIGSVIINSDGSNNILGSLILHNEGGDGSQWRGNTLNSPIAINASGNVKEFSLQFHDEGSMTLQSVILVKKGATAKQVTLSDGRQYFLYVPDNKKDNCELVVSLHGSSAHNIPDTNFDGVNFNTEATTNGFVVVYPQGVDTSFPIGFGGTTTGWTADGTANADVTFIKNVIADVKAKGYTINEKKMYLVGFSNGGMMTYSFANADNNVFAAYGSSGGFPMNEFHLKVQDRKTAPVIHVHYKGDTRVTYSLLNTIRDVMVARYGHDASTSTQEDSGQGYDYTHYSKANVGDFDLYEASGGGHYVQWWAAEAMWNFFKNKTLDDLKDSDLEWQSSLEKYGTNSFDPTLHGWTSGSNSFTYGTKKTSDNSDNNVYHDIQLKSGKHKIKVTLGEGNSADVTVTLLKASDDSQVATQTISTVGVTEIPFTTAADGTYKIQVSVPTGSKLTDLGIYELSGYKVTFSSNYVSMGTVAATANGKSINSGDYVPAGTEVTFTASPIGTNLIYNWSGADYHATSITKTINEDYTVVANFVTGIDVTAVTNDANQGTVVVEHWGSSNASLHMAPNPGDVTFRATAKEGYVFSGWYTDEARTSLKSTDNPYVWKGGGEGQITDQNVTLYAKFEQGCQVTFSAVQSDGTTDASSWGTVTATVDGKSISSGDYVQSGKTVTFTATPTSSDYLSWGWYKNGTRDWGNNTATVDGNLEIKYVFDPGIHVRVNSSNNTLGTAKATWGEQTNVTDIHTTKFPGSVTFNATAAEGDNRFIGWYSDAGCNTLVSTDNPFTTQSAYETAEIRDNDYTLYAKFVSGAFSENIDLTNWNAGHGGNVSSVTNGTIIVKGGSDNWVTAKTIGNEINQEKEQYTGVELNTQGDAWRIIVKYTTADGTVDQVIKNVDAATNKTKIYYSWSMLGVPTDSKYKIQEVRFSGKQDWSLNAENTSTFTVTDAKLVKVTENTSDYVTLNDGYAKFNLNKHANFYSGFEYGNIEWTYKDIVDDNVTEKDHATMKTAAQSYNMMQIFDFNGYSASTYTGVHVKYQGEHFRLIAYTSDSKTFIATVDGSADAITEKHIDWSLFGMTDADVANINKVSVAGCSNHADSEAVDFYELWLDKMYSFTVWTDESHGEGAYSAYKSPYSDGYGDVTYTSGLEGKTVAVMCNNMNGKSRHDGEGGCNGIYLINGKPTNDDGTEANVQYNSILRIDPIEGYKITKVRIGLSCVNEYNLAFDCWGTPVNKSGTGDYVEFTNSNDLTTIFIENKGSNKLHIKYVTFEYEKIAINESRQVTFASDGSNVTRDYWIYVPSGVYTNKTTAVPVVFSLHGSGNDYYPTDGGVQNFNDLAEANNFIVVYPRGRDLKFFGFNGGAYAVRGWEATGVENEDTRYLLAIANELIAENSKAEKQFSVNENQLYLTGYSNGGMMAYACANATSHKFAAYAAVSGFPVNEMHHQHYAPRAVPFLAIHGKADDFVNYKHLPNIVDNMLARNGLPYTPTSTASYNGVNYSAYTADGKQSFYLYEVDGMGHNKECTINGQNSKAVIWGFFKDRITPAETTVEFAPDVNSANDVAKSHGWTINEDKVLARYGESGGYSTDGENTYHSLQLRAGNHCLKFTLNNSDKTKTVDVRLNKLGSLSNFDHLPASELQPFAVTSENILKKDGEDIAYYCDGDIVVNFTTDEAAEYELLFVKGNASDETTISNIQIVSGSGTETNNKLAEATATTDFGGYYRFVNRLSSQWNFDQCDGYRFNQQNLSSEYWQADTRQGDTQMFTYKKAIGNLSADDTKTANYAELTYDGNTTHKIPITAGLLFNAPANQIQIKVSYNANGTAKGARLVVNENVKMIIPYVENTFRNDMGSNTQPDPSLGEGEVSERTEGSFKDYVNCMHHIKRDILYVSLEAGNVWDQWKAGSGWKYGHIVNKCIDDESKELFFSGGEEFVNGVHWYKMNYMGNHGTPCVVRFQKSTSINRLAVNRNLTYSFYPEYISDLNMEKPLPRTRVVGNPQGQKVANFGSTATTYDGAIAVTFGGWMNSKGGSSYKPYSNDATARANAHLDALDSEGYVTDNWTDLGVYVGTQKFLTWADMASNTPTQNYNVPVAPDGFPVMTMNREMATSGALMPEGTSSAEYFAETVDGKEKKIPNYHPLNNGKLYVGSGYPYMANKTPWSLPVRGGYLKFEPSLPGVLNVHVGQQANVTYYIVDEFGVPQTAADVFTKTATTNNNKRIMKVDATGTEVADANSYGFKLHSDLSFDFDYVKYSFNVYPGKTYYFFSNETGLGFCGMYFEPFVIRDNVTNEFARTDVGVDEVTLADGTNYAYPTLPKASKNEGKGAGIETIYSPKAGSAGTETEAYDIRYSAKAVKVKLQRSFKAKTWSSICLPYSMNQVQMEKIFGEGSRVVLLRDLQDKQNTEDSKVTLTLICHENQDIIAGYPYFIYPTKDVSDVTSYACLDKFPQHTDKVPTIVTVNSAGPNTNYYGNYTYQGIDQFTFKGTFANTTVKDGSFYVSTAGTLKKLQTSNKAGANLKPYRAWIDLNADVTDPSWAKNIEFVDGMPSDLDDETSTDIDGIDISQLLESQGIFTNKTTVYGINGQVVRTNATNLNDLPKGIYIVNGKKYIVK